MNLVTLLLDEGESNVVDLAVLIYDLSEQGLPSGEELMEESLLDTLGGSQEESIEESRETLTKEPELMYQISDAYKDDDLI